MLTECAPQQFIDWGEIEPVNDDDGCEEAIERGKDPNPSVTSFESFQEKLFSQVNIRKHLEIRKIVPVRLEIPLCRLKPTTWVRQALPADVQTVYEGFHIGNWGTNFWVTCCGSPGKFPGEGFEDLGRWQALSDEFDAELKKLCDTDPENKGVYERIIGQYVNVWDGNHRALAWMQHIKENNGDPIKVSCFVLNDTEADRGWISNFMRDINDGTSNTTVKKQLAHVLYEVMQIAKRDPKEYSHYFSDDEMIRINDVCKGRWYNMTCDAVTEVYFKREITLAEREGVKALKEEVKNPTPKQIEEAKFEGAHSTRKEKLDYMKKIFRLCNPKYHPHLADELDAHTRAPQRKTGAMTIDNLGILVGAQGVDIHRVLKLWNGTTADKERYHFPDLDFTRAAFQKWLNRRAWWEQMGTRAFEILSELVSKSKPEKGVGIVRAADLRPHFEEYFDKVMVYGFYNFFPEIFIPDGGPVRHKCWKDQITYDMGEKAVRRFVMRFVRWICETTRLLPRESGDISKFPVFQDWLRISEEGVYTKEQISKLDPPHLKGLGWYIENVPDVEGFLDVHDEALLGCVLKEIEALESASFLEKAEALDATLEEIKELVQSKTDLESGDSDTVVPSSTLLSALSGRQNKVYVPISNSWTSVAHYVPVMFHELQEMIAFKTGKEVQSLQSQVQDGSGSIPGAMSDVEGVNAHPSVPKPRNSESNSDAQEGRSGGHLHNLRPKKISQEVPVADDLHQNVSEIGSSQRKTSSKTGKKLQKSSLPGKYEALKIEGVAPTVKLSMNFAFDKFVEGMKQSDFNSFLGAIKQINGGRLRQHNRVWSPHCVDLILCDTPDNSEVPDVTVNGRSETPPWNMVKRTTFPAIFHVAESVLADSGFILLFVPAEEQPTLMSPVWASDWECMRTFYVINHRPFSPLWKRLFKAKVLRRKSMSHIKFQFNEIASKVMDWNPESSDVLENVVTDENLLRCEETVSYRGSKQKSPAFMETMIEICTGKGSAVLDLTGGIGSSVRACELSGRHVLALEADEAAYNMCLNEFPVTLAADRGIEDSRLLTLHQHFAELDAQFSHPTPQPALSGSSNGIAI
ncbi:hypothetical protein M758_11G066700 [Ceratodon purpureus]|nr:hypothetical protein M758_11G066700 [Ceratodon purpureus]